MVLTLGLAVATPPGDPGEEAPSEVVVVHPERPLEARSPASVTVLEVDAESPQSDDLASFVGRAAGVTVTRLGGLGDLATIRLRGSSARQVEIYLDGVPLNPDGIGAVDLAELPLHAFERVEIWKGDAPIGLGGTAMGGAVNLITDDRDTLDVRATAGSFGSARLSGLVAREHRGIHGFGHLQIVSTAGRYRWYDDRGTRYDTRDDQIRVRSNNDARHGSFQGRLRFGDRTRITLFDSFHGREEGVPGPTAAPTAQVRYRAARNLAVLQVERGLVRGRVHHRAHHELLLDPAREIALEGGKSRTRTQSLAADLWLASAGKYGQIAAVAGVAYDTRLEGGSRWIARGQTGVTGRFGRFTVAPALAAVKIESRGAGTGNTTAVLPRIGVLAQMERAVLKANLGRYYRPPDLLELFGNRGSLAGRDDLRPEQGINADLGFRHDDERGSIELGGFASWSRDLIVYVQNAQRIGVPTNLGAGRIYGLELAIHRRAGRVASRTDLTVQRTVNTSAEPLYAGRRLPRLPWLALHQRTTLSGSGWRFGHTFSLTDGWYTDPVNLQRQPTRHLHGLFVRVERGRTAIAFDLRNLLDQKVAPVPVNPFDPDGVTGPGPITDFVGYPLPGRSLWVSVRYGESSAR